MLEEDKLDKEYTGLFADGQMMNNPIYGQTSYNCCPSNAFKLKLGHNLKIFLVEMRSDREEDCQACN